MRLFLVGFGWLVVLGWNVHDHIVFKMDGVCGGDHVTRTYGCGVFMYPSSGFLTLPFFP